MKHLIGFIIFGTVILTIGPVLGGSLHSEIGAVASATAAAIVDGQSQSTLGTSLPDPASSSPLLAGATVYRSYAANEFHSTHSDLTYASFGPAIYALNIPAGGFSFKLPVDLPNGVQVSRITVYLVDNSPGSNMTIQLYRVNLSNATQIELSSVSTSGLPTSSAVQTVSMSGSPLAVIDTVNYAYALRYAPTITGSLHQIVGAQIEYNFLPAAYLPIVIK
jgi:hypothetical protein